ncbi:MAG: glycosyltransferase N-terminal domain-containing protein [Gammaproteobacteria bacterium]|jgi:3-deoxy-D-manno-octulosonic-acid transferase
MSRITTVAYFIVYSLALPALAFRLMKSPGRVRLRQRFGFGLPQPKAQCIWLHASSVGEVALLEPIVEALERDEPDTPLLITAFTATGIATAEQRFPQHSVYAFPFDYSFAVRRFVRSFGPRLAVIVESEFWPGFLSVMQHLKVPVAILNAKMSQRSLKAHARTKFVAQALRQVAVIATQDAANAARFRELGVDPQRVHVTGNMKYDLVSPAPSAATRATLGIDDDTTVIIGGSLHDGESEALLEAVFVPRPIGRSVKVLLAPRYTEAAGAICAAAENLGLRSILKSALTQGAVTGERYDVCVIDTFGELRSLYSVADVVFVGGSLFDRGSARGGHNLMEPAICGVPVLFGPYNYSFAQVAGELRRAGGGSEVRTVTELREALLEISSDSHAGARMGAAARAVVLAGQGGTARNLDLVRGLLEQCSH